MSVTNRRLTTCIVLRTTDKFGLAALFFLILCAVLLTSGCETERVPTTLPGAHPDTWMAKSSPDFHGKVVLGTGTASCSTCHGTDLNGGRVEVSCVECHTHQTELCVACHGGLVEDDRTGAPPFGLRGETADTTLAVGAHAVHLNGSAIAAGMHCTSCHRVPAFVLDSAHFDHRMTEPGGLTDSIAEITWGNISNKNGTPQWNRATRSCAATYCHGNFEGGNADNSPVWTGQDQADCGSCHDIGGEPAKLLWKHSFHMTTAGLDCRDCHAQVVDSIGQIINLSLHVNGVIDTLTHDTAKCSTCHGGGTVSCTGCHGGTDNLTGAPPRGLRGEEATSDRAVGAHTAHLDGSPLAAPLPCTECHKVPASTGDDGHLAADSIAEITWGPLANINGGATWSRTNSTCTNTYCHGAFSGGDSNNSPSWIGTDQATCGSCHDDGTTPSDLLWKHDTHVRVAGLKCADCHAQVIDTSGLFVDRALHVNGLVDTLTRDSAVCNVCHSGGAQSCVSCHGGVDNQTGAPPQGLRGEILTSTRAVGAHSKHLSGGTIAAGLACADCHTVPATMLDPGHLGTDSVAEVTWHGISDQSGGASWNRLSNNCASTYCHGNFPGGKSGNAPVWTSADQATCGSCHDAGTQPGELLWKHEFHVSVAGLKCADCHAQVVDLSNNIADLDLHVNGTIDTLTRDSALCNTCHGSGTQSCTICHGGTDNQTGAPPRGLHGETLTSARSVGAHSRHLTGGQIANGRSCSNCHTVPTSVVEPGHMGADSIAEISWSGISNKTGGANWNRISNNCGLVYCHGNFVGGKTNNAPVWNSANQATCGSCHDVGTQPSLLLWKHDTHVTLAGLTCADCHGNVVGANLTISNKDLHVNGIVDTLTQTPSKCAKCHSGGADRCIRCHGGTNSLAGDPPTGLRGETATSTLAVGAHDKHLRGGTISDGGACLDCHVVPAQIISNGHLAADSVAEIIWGNYANKNGGAAWNRTTRTCASTYCHGNFSGGRSANAPTWTGTNQAACGSCHDTGTNPSQLLGRHSKHINENVECYQCHSTTVNSSNAVIGLSLHINNVNNVSFWNGTGTYNASSRQCSNPGGCHGTEDW